MKRLSVFAAAVLLLASCSPRLAPGSVASEGTAFQYQTALGNDI